MRDTTDCGRPLPCGGGLARRWRHRDRRRRLDPNRFRRRRVSSLAKLRVEGVAQSIADERETEHGQRQDERGEQAELPVHAYITERIGHHLPPTRQWIVDPKA